MKYVNEHKQLIGKFLEVNPQLEKWQARMLANRKIGKEILVKKSLKDEITNEIKKSEFEAMSQLKALKVEIRKAKQSK